MGFQPDFEASINRLLADYPGLTINSGYRSVGRQAELWANALRKYGNPSAARKWVAPPGRSYHNKGLAADLGYADDAMRKVVHANANRYGLHFPMAHEPWHIEPIGTRGGDFSGGGGSDSLVGGIRDGSGASDTLGGTSMAKPVKYDPLPQTSGHFDPVSAAGHESLSPSSQQSQRRMVASALRSPRSRRGGLFGGGILKGGILGGGLLGQRGANANKGDFTASQKLKLEARLGPDWNSMSREDQLAVLYPAPKASGGGAQKTSSPRAKTSQSIPSNSLDEIARLSGLPPLDYERERQKIADTWGVRVQTIDTAVTRYRKDRRTQEKSDAPTKPGKPVVNAETMLENARRLVEDGTPREKVVESLKRLGIDPNLL